MASPSLKGRIIVCIGLTILTLIPYWQIQGHDFINYDDNVYVTDNRHVQQGMRGASVRWAFSSTEMGFWHPLTWLSLMLDYELFKLNPSGYHWTNLLFHILNTLLLFLVLQRMTGASLKSGFVAALFALHPLHVESVAWITERKDVLSTFFWMLTMGAYVWYVEHPSWRRYLGVLAPFILGLMSKPMLVTLPYVMLLLDYWPLGRMQCRDMRRSGEAPARLSVGEPGETCQKTSLYRLILEKVPLILLTIPFMWLAIYAQNRCGAITSLEVIPFAVRLVNAAVAYGTYILKTLWPQGLSIFYPHTGMQPPWLAILCLLLLAFTSFAVVRGVKKYPFLLMGWFWYLGTLVPVIGLIQIGRFSHADRYTYIPLIGLFIMAVWGIPEMVKKWNVNRRALVFISGSVLLVLMYLTWNQVATWRNDWTLFSHALQVTENNYKAHNNIGMVYLGRGDDKMAERHLVESIRIQPEVVSLNNLGLFYVKQGRFTEAERMFRLALKAKPDDTTALNNLGRLLAHLGKRAEAISLFESALRIDPDDDVIRRNLRTAQGEDGEGRP